MHFHVVVVQWQKKCKTLCDSCTCKVIVLTFSLLSPSSDANPCCRYWGWAYTLQPQSLCMALNCLWGMSLRHVALYFESAYRLCRGGGEAKRTGERTEPSWSLVWGGEGPFLLPSSPLGSLCLPLFCFVLFFFFFFTPTFAFSPHYGTWAKASYRCFLCLLLCHVAR